MVKNNKPPYQKGHKKKKKEKETIVCKVVKSKDR